MAVGVRANGSGTISQGAGASLALTKPAGVTDGDLLVAIVQSDHQSASLTGPSGWTKDATTTHISAWWKIASAEPASWTWTDTTNVYAIAANAYTGANATQPDVTSQVATGATTAASAPATAATPSAGCYELALFQDFNGGTFTTPTGFTLEQSNTSSTYFFDQGPLTPSGVLPAVASTDSSTAWSAIHFVARAAVAAAAPPETHMSPSMMCGDRAMAW